MSETMLENLRIFKYKLLGMKMVGGSQLYQLRIESKGVVVWALMVYASHVFGLVELIFVWVWNLDLQ